MWNAFKREAPHWKLRQGLREAKEPTWESTAVGIILSIKIQFSSFYLKLKDLMYFLSEEGMMSEHLIICYKMLNIYQQHTVKKKLMNIVEIVNTI